MIELPYENGFNALEILLDGSSGKGWAGCGIWRTPQMQTLSIIAWWDLVGLKGS